MNASTAKKSPAKKSKSTSGIFPLDKQACLQAYRTMRPSATSRNKLHGEFAKGDIPGFVHLYAGEEASGTGIMMHLEGH